MNISRKILSLLCVGLVSSAVTARAGIMSTASGTATGGDGPLSASAVFSINGDVLEITLTNTLSPSDFQDQGQALSGISFDLSASRPCGGSVSNNTPCDPATESAVGQQGNEDSSGKVTYVSGSPDHWLISTDKGASNSVIDGSTSSGSTVLLTAIGGGQPFDMIAPSMTNGGSYGRGTGGSGNFDPYGIGPVTIYLTLPGITQFTTISDITFSFGTGPDTTLGGSTPVPVVPEPSSLMLLGTGVVGMAGMLRRRMFASKT